MKSSKQFALVFAFLGTFSCTAQLSAQAVNPISITEIRPVQSPSGEPLFQITYTVNVPKGQNLYIDDIGFVESNSSLTYITGNSHLVARSTPGGAPLSDTVLAPNVLSMSGSLTLVAQSDFKYPGGQSISFVSNRFRSSQAQIVATYFLLPPYIYSSNSMTISESLYHQVPVNSKNLIVEVAVQLRFSADRSDTHFEMKYAARERRKGTEWQAELGSEAESAVKEFIAKIQKELEALNGHA